MKKLFIIILSVLSLSGFGQGFLIQDNKTIMYMHNGRRGALIVPVDTSLQHFWNSLQSSVVENSNPNKLILTFTESNTYLQPADFKVTDNNVVLIERDVENKILTLTLEFPLIFFDEDLHVKLTSDLSLTNPIINNVIDDGHTVAWYQPTNSRGARRYGNGVEPIYWDLMSDSTARGAEINSGAIVQYAVYEITATQTNFFYTGCAIGDVFVCGTVKTCDANNKVKIVTGNHLTQYTATTYPINGVFDGTNDFLKTAPMTIPQPITAYTILEHKSYTANDVVWRNALGPYLIEQGLAGNNQFTAHAGTSSGAPAFKVEIDSPTIVRTVFNGAGSTHEVNLQNKISANFGAGYFNNSNFTLASWAGAGDYSNIKLHALILRDTNDNFSYQTNMVNAFGRKFNSPKYPDMSGESVSLSIKIAGTLTMATMANIIVKDNSNVYISFGDGEIRKIANTGTDPRWISKTYLIDDSTYIVKLTGDLDSIIKIQLNNSGWNIDFDELAKCGNLEYIQDLYRPNTLNGSLTPLTKLKELWMSRPIVVGGGLTGTTDSLLLLEVFECQGEPGNYHMANITGSFENIPKLKQFCAVTKHTGVITTLVDLEYFSWGYVAGGIIDGTVQSTPTPARLSGDMSNMTNLWWFTVNSGYESITGSFALLASLENFASCPPLMTKPANLLANPKLCNFYTPTTWVLSETEVNTYLANIWANREVVRTYLKNTDGTSYGEGYRTIDLNANVGSSAPTGQGIIDKNNLNTTINPATPGNGVVWTVITN
jgi:hypothetical protein